MSAITENRIAFGDDVFFSTNGLSVIFVPWLKDTSQTEQQKRNVKMCLDHYRT